MPNQHAVDSHEEPWNRDGQQKKGNNKTPGMPLPGNTCAEIAAVSLQALQNYRVQRWGEESGVRQASSGVVIENARVFYLRR